MADEDATDGAWTPYAHRRVIGWGDVDPARIAYTGRFADFMMEAIEGWYRDRLDTDWYRLNLDEGCGTPFVQLSLAFKHPVTPREPIDVLVLHAARADRRARPHRPRRPDLAVLSHRGLQRREPDSVLHGRGDLRLRRGRNDETRPDPAPASGGHRAGAPPGRPQVASRRDDLSRNRRSTILSNAR